MANISLSEFIEANKKTITPFTVIMERGGSYSVVLKKYAEAWKGYGWEVVHEGLGVPEPKGAKKSEDALTPKRRTKKEE